MTRQDDMDAREAAALLAWQVEMGADEAIAEMPIDRLAGEKPPAPPRKEMPPAAPEAARPRQYPPQVPPCDPVAQEQVAQAARCATLEEIAAALDAMRDFPLRATATHTVHTDGNPHAHVMLIGEAPGRDEDLRGRPFVGRSGQLLDRMLAAIGLSRQAEEPERSVLISNVVFWRPPGNRKPTEQEAAHCLPWLERTIEIARPRIIVCLGATPAHHLTGQTKGILKLRGTWLDYAGKDGVIPLLPTLHPAYLLRQPVQKRLAWRDFLSLKIRLEELRQT